MLPDAGIAAVLLTHSDECGRRRLALLYDGKRKAEAGSRIRSGNLGSHKNDDASMPFITASPTPHGSEFAVGQRLLITRDRQHDHVFTEK